MMTLLGELEFNDLWFHPCGGPQTFLFVGTDKKGIVTYSLSPFPDHWHVGDLYNHEGPLSVFAFMKMYVNRDARYSQEGRGVIQSFSECKMRLKGFQEWIGRD